jgi:hypothetical protein
VARLLLAGWLSVFALQTSDLIVLVAGDTCSDEIRGAAGDSCPQNCPRCVCCAQRLPVVTVALAGAPADPAPALIDPPSTPALPSPPAHRILHVPKHLLA